MQTDERKLLFISHANPQDNAAASWFATQLTLLGYDVWCDLKNMAAAESDLWLKIQKTIENEAAKFIFVLSNTSRDFDRKRGVYKELQAADNLGRDNFILPLKIEKLHGNPPILIAPDVYIEAENWAEGLSELRKRLSKDGVPRSEKPDYAKIVSWWPAVSAREALVRKQPTDVRSNNLKFVSLPRHLYLLKVFAEGNLLSGRDQLKGALPSNPSYATHGQLVVSFGSSEEFSQVMRDYDIVEHCKLETESFMKSGYAGSNILPDAARNIVTYLVASSFEKLLGDKGLSSKQVGLSRKRIWFPARNVIKGNKHSISEQGNRKAPVWFVGEVTSFRKKYVWHFGVQPTIDLRVHLGIVLVPKVVIAAPYAPEDGEKPVPLDEKRAARKVSSWNKDLRRRILAFADWLADGDETIDVPVGCQTLTVSTIPEAFISDTGYLEKTDDEVINEILDWGANAPTNSA